MESKRKNILFITGTNIKRTKIKEFRQQISRDKDIKRLIRLGTLGVNRNPLYSAGFLLLSFVFGWLTIDSFTDIRVAISNLRLYNITLYPLLLAIYSVSALIIQLISQALTVRDFFIISPDARKSIKFIKKGNAPKSPLELWDVLQASIMDAQLTTSAERLFDTDASVIYGGEPYYNLLVTDSIYISWHGLERAGKLRCKAFAKRFFRHYARKTILGEVEQKYFTKDSRLQVSNCVFGTLFLSEYLQNFIEKFGHESDGTIYIDCSEIKNVTKSISKKTAALAAKEVLGYATNPMFFSFHNKSEHKVALKVAGISFIQAEIEKKADSRKEKRELRKQKLMRYLDELRWKHECQKKGLIRIPLKKLVAIPTKQDNPADPLPGTMIDHDSVAKIFDSALVLGGAEQNIILSILINRYKWRFDGDQYAPAEFHYIGFAENAFDASGLEHNENTAIRGQGHVDFLIGTEGFVYGYDGRTLRAQVNHMADSRMAEVFKLTINNFTYYFVYGYHAVSTKIATLKLFVYLAYNEVKYLPDERLKRITYFLKCPDGDSFDDLCDFWDKGDPINASREVLLKKLEMIENKNII